MRRRLTISSGVAAVITIGAFVGGGAVAQGSSPKEKIDVCHRTGSQTKPYVLLQVSPDKLAGEHEFHRTHTGPIGPLEHGEWGDIIPPQGEFAGMNWDSLGRAIVAAGCDVEKAKMLMANDQSVTTTTAAPTTTTSTPSLIVLTES